MKKIIKGIVMTMLLAVVMISASSCRRWSDNGKIDGYWKIQEIYYIADGTTVKPEQRFISVQLELLQLQMPKQSTSLTGILHYNKSDDFFTVDFPYNPSDELLSEFGFQGAQSRLEIVKADSKHLVLESPIAVITCRRW